MVILEINRIHRVDSRLVYTVARDDDMLRWLVGWLIVVPVIGCGVKRHLDWVWVMQGYSISIHLDEIMKTYEDNHRDGSHDL